jgi:serine protease Do
MVNQLRATGHVDWAWFGLQLQPLHDFNKDIYFEGTEGVIVAETDPDSPARSAGIQSRDRILAINGTTLKGITEEDLSGIRRQIGLLPKGQEASFLLQRGEEKLTVKIAPREKGAVEGKEVAYKRWDLTVKEINQFDNPDLYFYRNKGVFVYATKYPGNASNAGLRNGDIIVKVETSEVNSIADIEKIHTETVDKLSSKPRIVFTVMRAGLTRQVVVDMQRDYSKE